MRTARSAEMRNAAAKFVAVAGAVSLVLGFVIASLLNPFLSLGGLLSMQWPGWMADFVRAPRAGAQLWMWDNLAMPLLLRPAWLLPTMVGIVFVGLAAQLAWGKRR